MSTIKALLIALLLTPLSTLQASYRKTGHLPIQLQQAKDANCDGIMDTPYATNKALSILPNQCVMYKITAKNNTKNLLNELTITGNIPIYTQLKTGSSVVYKNGKLQPNVTFHSLDSAQINARVIKLAPLKTITMFYSVRVN